MSFAGFRCISADPPWPFKDALPGGGRGAAKHYATMTVGAICAHRLPPLHRDCWLFLWRPATHQQPALDVARAWGFDAPPAELIWRKMTKDGQRVAMGMGRSVRNAHETCLVFRRGKPQRLSASILSIFDAPRGEHSAKPAAFYALVDELVPGPHVELFARRQWPGWTCLGAEMPGPVRALGSAKALPHPAETAPI